jgi:hypothetical protein
MNKWGVHTYDLSQSSSSFLSPSVLSALLKRIFGSVAPHQLVKITARVQAEPRVRGLDSMKSRVVVMWEPHSDNPVSQALANSGVLARLAIHVDNAAYATGAF